MVTLIDIQEDHIIIMCFEQQPVMNRVPTRAKEEINMAVELIGASIQKT